MGLNKKEIEEFKERLIDLRRETQSAFEGIASSVKTPDEAKGASQHHADEGTDDFGRTISIEVTTKELAIIKQIERALQKIEDGTYGVCDLSGKDIPRKRLEAIPYATTTVEAQEQFEKGLL